VRAKELIKTLDKVGTLSVGENIVRVYPGTRFCSCFSIVGVETILDRTAREQVRKNKLLRERH
jgi:hypothetical protein